MSDAMLALGAGLQSFGRGWQGLREQDEARRRYEAEKAARQAEIDENRAWRTEQSEFQRSQQRELRRSRRRAEIQDYWARQGIVIDPDRLNALLDAEEQAEQQIKTTATGAPSPAAQPSGDPLDAGSTPVPGAVDTGFQADGAQGPTPPATPRSAAAMAEIARRGLEASRSQQGARVQLDDGWGFARDEDAYTAAQRAQQQRDADERERRLRMEMARIGAASRGGGGVSNLNAQINNQEQAVTAARNAIPKRTGPAAVATYLTPDKIARDPVMATADSAFRADSTQAAGRLTTEQARLDALKILNGDSDLFASQGAKPLSIPSAAAPTAPSAPSALQSDPTQMELAQEAQRAIARIVALPIPEAEKMARVQRVNQRLAEAVRGAR